MSACRCEWAFVVVGNSEPVRSITYCRLHEAAPRLLEALEHATASLEHLMLFKGSRLEETQRLGHERNITRGRAAIKEASNVELEHPRILP